MDFFNLFRNTNNKQRQRIFLDYASTTPVDASVQEVMNNYETGFFANPSALYKEALSAKEILNNARQKIAEVFNVQKKQIFFTSGGTEGNNLALLGVFEAFKTDSFKPHFITTTIEHSSVLEVCKEIERRGGEVTYLPVSSEGIVSSREILSALKENTVLVSVMYVNNEIGTIQPIREIGKILQDWKLKNNKEIPYFHTDACQAVLYKELDMQKLRTTMMTIDGIKMYGPRGIGVLAIKGDIKINPVIFGGGQENNLRSGTENVGAIVGLARAFEIAEKLRESELERLTDIRDYTIKNILKTFQNATLNGSRVLRLPNNINICFPGLDAEFAVISLDVLGISASYSSSCRNLKEDSSSYVVESLGKRDCSNSSLRFTLGRETQKEDVDILIDALKKIMLQ
ncbi:MAG: cysteine desulfurase family protein [Minisyncoccia bacterium]